MKNLSFKSLDFVFFQSLIVHFNKFLQYFDRSLIQITVSFLFIIISVESSVSKDKPLSSSSLVPQDDLVGVNDSSSIANNALENSKSINDAAFVQDFHLNLNPICPDVKDYPEQQ